MAKKVTKPSKPAPKVAKPAAKKAAPSKKAAPAKKVAKPAPKPAAKPAPKKAVKPVAKKAIKPAAKPVAKPVVKPAAKKVVKPVAKQVVKPIAKKPSKPVQPLKKKAAKPVSKKIEKETPKKSVKPIPKAAVKPEVKKSVKPSAPAPKPAAKAPAKPAAKAPVKPAVKAAPAPVAPPVHVKPVAKTIPGKKITVEKSEKIISNTNTPFNDKPLEKEKPVFTSIVPKKTVIEDIGKTRYSDIELEEFRKLINEKLASAKKELDNLKEALNNISGNSAADTESSYATFEDGSATQEKEHLSQMAARQRKFIGNLDAALGRIENKTYGICAVTGKLIPKERLRAVPHTTVSIEAKLGKV